MDCGAAPRIRFFFFHLDSRVRLLPGLATDIDDLSWTKKRTARYRYRLGHDHHQALIGPQHRQRGSQHVPRRFQQGARSGPHKAERAFSGGGPGTVPAGTQPDSVLRLRGKGLPHFGSAGRGDLFLRVQVRVPERLSAEEKALYDRLRALEGRHR
ncbi:MAG: DnaJ C-terminal domain-containing protein [Acidobacteriota bacterium]